MAHEGRRLTRREFVQTLATGIGLFLGAPRLFAKDTPKTGSGGRIPADLHYSLRGIGDRLAGYEVPRGSFNPAGPWVLEYEMYMTNATRAVAGKMRSMPWGRLRMEKRPTAGGIAYVLTMSAEAGGDKPYLAEARIDCAAARLVKGWQARREFPARGGDRVAPIEEKAAVSGGVTTIIANGIRSTLPVAGILLPFPGLVDACANGKIFSGFTLLDEHLSVKEAQHAGSAGSTSLACDAGRLALNGYYHCGEGIHPAHYWCAGNGLPLFITQGLRSYMLVAVG